jgi:hydrogenase maturation factor HypF (carbamoyltransferase family)
MAKRKREKTVRKKKVSAQCVKCGTRKNLIYGTNPYDETKGNTEAVWLCRRCRTELEEK